MDVRVTVLLAAEALFALLIIYRAGFTGRSPARLLLSVFLLVAAFYVRFLCLDYQTLDYKNFLSGWVDFFRFNGGFAALRYPVGNYNIPYLYFLALFSYSSINDLYLIKLLSIFFDVLLAYAAAQLLGKVKRSPDRRLACFFAVLFLPTVILNGALWGQCDSIYVALALLAIYQALDDRPVMSVISFTLSFGFKLQAVFIMPVIAVLWMKRKYRLPQLLLFPLSYILLVLPAVALGRPFIDTLTLYFNQAGSIGSGLNYNSPSIYSFFYNVSNEALAARLGIIAAFAAMLLVLAVCFIKRHRLSNGGIIISALLFAILIPLLLPHMHDRYFFAADIISLVAAFCFPLFAVAPVLAQFASLLGYHAYLRMRYLLPMRYGACALIALVLMLFPCLFSDYALSEKKFKK